MARVAVQGLTPKEQKLMKFIEQYQLKHGFSPTVREMREYMKLKSDGFVVHMTKRLAAKKFIHNVRRPRGIKAFEKLREKLATPIMKVPVLGYVPAGGPVLAEQLIEDWISIDPAMIKHKKDVFFLRVRGESMINAGILDRDYVLVYAKAEPKASDIVVALVDNQNTVKRFMKDKSGRPYLKAENPEFEDIRPGPGEELSIQGVVIGLLRWYQ